MNNPHVEPDFYSLTGSSSLDVHTPVTCRCCMTCLIWRSDGRATQPAVIHTCRGLSNDRPNSAQASLANISQMSSQWTGSSNEAYGDFSIPVRLYRRHAINCCTSVDQISSVRFSLMWIKLGPKTIFIQWMQPFHVAILSWGAFYYGGARWEKGLQSFH